jgi:hypothetical protein
MKIIPLLVLILLALLAGVGWFAIAVLGVQRALAAPSPCSYTMRAQPSGEIVVVQNGLVLDPDDQKNQKNYLIKLVFECGQDG